MRFAIVLFVLLKVAVAQSYDLKQIRLEYYQAINSEKLSEKFYEDLKGRPNKDAILLAYYGSAQAIRAKHVWNPYLKLNYARNGMKQVDKAVGMDPEHLEIRFLRFSLEYYLPSILGLSKHLDEDKKTIIRLIENKQLRTVDKVLLKDVVAFMIETKKCTTAEINVLKNAIKNG